MSKFCSRNRTRKISLGLITVDRTAGLYGIKDMYTFLHLTFQEYLAACHISTLSDEEQLKLIQQHGEKLHMLVVWKFYCGLVENLKFESILDKTAGRILYHIQCAYESQKSLICIQLLEHIGYHIRLNNEYLTTTDFTAIGYVVKNSKIPTELSISRCIMTTEAIDALWSEMGDKNRTLEGLHFVAMGSKSIQEVHKHEVQYLERLLVGIPSLRKLSINYGKDYAQLPSSTLKIVGKTCSSLTEFCVENVFNPVGVFYVLVKILQGE